MAQRPASYCPLWGSLGEFAIPIFHVKDQDYLVDKAASKEALVNVSRELVANRVERITDYADVMTGFVVE